MKKYILLYILLVNVASIIQAQDKSRFYGLNRGSFLAGNLSVTQQYGTLNNTVITANKYSGVQSFPLSFDAIPFFRDSSLNNYEIGKIPEQSVAAGSILHFYIRCDELSSLKSYSITPIGTIKGVIRFDLETQYFSFKPDSLDNATYQIKFNAFNLTDTISQIVTFRTYQVAHPEIYSFGVGNAQPMPNQNAREYQLLSIINSDQKIWFNGQNRSTRSISISGVDLSVENVPGNFLFTISGNKDIAQLNIYADRLFIKDTLHLPQTEVNIYCRQLIFQDGTNPAIISTTPVAPIAAIPNANGNNGATAGRINLFAGKMIDNSDRIRFRLIGGDGQSVTDATAGSGGNGGTLFSNQYIAYKGDYLGGTGGEYKGDKGKAPLKNKGDLGKFEKDSINLRWIHPNYIRQYISFSKDAYYIGHGNKILPTLLFYSDLISELVSSPDTAKIDSYTMSDVMQTKMELVTLIDRIISGNDFFGNPPGWVPLLSFEFTKAAFDSELHHAMQILYLDYFISTNADTLQKRINGFSALRDELRQRSSVDRGNFNNLVLVKIPDIENNIDLNNKRIEQIHLDIENVTAQLQARADKMFNDQKKPSWQKIAGCIGQVATMVPYPGVQAAGAGILTGLQLYDGIKNIDNLNTESAMSIVDAGMKARDTFKNYKSQFGETTKQWENIGTQWHDFFPVFQGGINKDAIKSQVSKGTDLYKNLHNQFSKLESTYDKYLKVPDGTLQKIRSDLMANDPTLASLHTSMSEAAEKHKQLTEEFASTNNQILTLGSQIIANGLAFDNANNKVLSSSTTLDHRTVHYIHYLREEALDRLKKYYYYMAKAYEARTLLPFKGNLNLSPILNSIENMAKRSNNSVLSKDQYDSFSELYKQQIRIVAQDIYEFYLNNAPQKTITTTYHLSKDDINTLNEGETVIFNPTKRGLFKNNEENVRINNIKVLKLGNSTSPGSTIGNPAHIDITFEYPLVSFARRNGKVYYFNNYNRNTNTPITWSTRYDYITNRITDFKPSAANASLLISLCTEQDLPHDVENIQMYSRPSADADLMISSAILNNNGNGDLYINDVLVEIEYDFNYKPNSISYLDILTEPEWIVPSYNVNRLDQNGMKNGQGNMTRAYNTSTTNVVNLQVVENIGGYRFERWLNQGGSPVLDKDSVNPSRSFAMSQNRAMKVKYKWAGAKLSLPDTLYFDPNILTRNLVVKNIGESNSMYWVRDSISSFASITNNIANGFGNETLSITLSKLEKDTIGYLAIMAPEAENAIDTVWLKYTSLITEKKQIDDIQKIVLYPNPVKDKFHISFSDPLNTEYQVIITDSFGKGVNIKFEKQSNILTFDSSDLPTGIYFVAVKLRNNQQVLKFIKAY